MLAVASQHKCRKSCTEVKHQFVTSFAQSSNRHENQEEVDRPIAVKYHVKFVFFSVPNSCKKRLSE